MAPIRRYLQITKHSAIELRIHVEEPSLAQSWLLHPSPYSGRRYGDEAPLGPVLPRVIAAVRPAVERQLRDEQLRIRGRGTGSSGARRRKGVKDVASGEDFEVSVFLTEPSVRHSLLLKRKGLAGARTGMRGVKRREGEGLRNWLDGTGVKNAPLDLDELSSESEGDGDGENRARKRRRRNADEDQADPVILREESVSEDEGFTGGDGNAENEDANADNAGEGEGEGDDKKSLNIDTTYEGFSIYGRVLCLVVKPRGIALGKGKGKGRASSPSLLRSAAATDGGGGANADGEGDEQRRVATSSTARPMRIMESWVSTQAAKEDPLADNDAG